LDVIREEFTYSVVLCCVKQFIVLEGF